MTIKEALDRMSAPETPDTERWRLLAYVLRELMFALGINQD